MTSDQMEMTAPDKLPSFPEMKNRAIEEIQAVIGAKFGSHPDNPRFARREFENAEEHIRTILDTVTSNPNDYESHLVGFFTLAGVTEKTAKQIVKYILTL